MVSRSVPCGSSFSGKKLPCLHCLAFAVQNYEGILHTNSTGNLKINSMSLCASCSGTELGIYCAEHSDYLGF